MSDSSEVSFSFLAAAKESKFQGRAQKEGINSKIQLSPLSRSSDTLHTLGWNCFVTELAAELQKPEANQG